MAHLIRNHNPAFRNCICSKCGAEAHTKPETKHRRCTGQEKQGVKEKHAPKLSWQDRGSWM
jgi:hypothetical protein